MILIPKKKERKKSRGVSSNLARSSTMDAASLLTALHGNKSALWAWQAATTCRPPQFSSSLSSQSVIQAPVAGFGVTKQPYVQSQVMQAPVACGGTFPKTPPDASAQICQLKLLLDMLQASQALATKPTTTTAPVAFQQASSSPQQQPAYLPHLVATAVSMSIGAPSLHGNTTRQQSPLAPALAHLPPRPEPLDSGSFTTYSGSPGSIDSGMSTPADSDPDPDGADVGGTFMSRERILRIYSLRSRHTCTSSSPIEASAAGRSAVVARIYGMPMDHVRDIWSRACASHITEPVWAEYEEQRYENKMLRNLQRSALKRKSQSGKEVASRKRKCLVNSE
jgi:hypothetical protein